MKNDRFVILSYKYRLAKECSNIGLVSRNIIIKGQYTQG